VTVQILSQVLSQAESREVWDPAVACGFHEAIEGRLN
jgi:hypothetical protein